MDLAVERRSDGAIVLRSRIPLQEFEPCLPRVLAAQAARLGNKPYLVQRLGPQRAWTPHSYADTKRDTDAIAQWLLNRGVARNRPILLLSGNSIAHALVKFGGMAVGVPACPVSANYGLMDASFTRLRHVVAAHAAGRHLRRECEAVRARARAGRFRRCHRAHGDSGRCAARR